MSLYVKHVKIFSELNAATLEMVINKFADSKVHGHRIVIDSVSISKGSALLIGAVTYVELD